MPKTDPKDSPGNVNLETHPLVARLHADPDELTDLVALAGYLGPSKRAGYVRLYADLTFRNYCEIPTEGILSTTPADAGDENSPTTVHVSGGTQVDRVSITSQSTEARFLQGSIASDYLSGAGVGAGLGCSWAASPTCWCVTAQNCQQGAAQVAAPSMVYSCWCPITQHGCEQQAAQPYTDTVYHTCGCSMGNYTCNNCGQAGAQANAEPWPASPTCWCNITRNCAQQAPHTGYFCTLAPKCGQAGAQAGAQLWPVTGFCNYTKWQACTGNCGQAGAGDVGCSWPASPTCWCVHTAQGCT